MKGGWIVVADDDAAIAELIKINLESRGYEVVCVPDGEAALEAVRRIKPRCLVLDVMMPTMDGFEVCRRLREDEATALMPLIVVSAKDRPLDKITGLRLGADDYLVKPFDVEELLARVETLLRRTERCLDASPLTGLPGNVSIMRETRQRIRAGTPFAFIYADLDNFKPFNDKYGFERGDHVIRFAAGVLRECVPDGGFLGHVGGDDFVVLVPEPASDAVCGCVISKFDAGIAAFYDEGDRKAGRILSHDRRGRSRVFPVMTVSMGVATSAGNAPVEYGKIVQSAAELKEKIKAREPLAGSAFLKERRK